MESLPVPSKRPARLSPDELDTWAALAEAFTDDHRGVVGQYDKLGVDPRSLRLAIEQEVRCRTRRREDPLEAGTPVDFAALPRLAEIEIELELEDTAMPGCLRTVDLADATQAALDDDESVPFR